MIDPVEALDFTDQVRKPTEYEAFEFTVNNQTVHMWNCSLAALLKPSATDTNVVLNIEDTFNSVL